MTRNSSIAAAILICAFCLQALFALPQLSATADEPVHLAAGYSYWQTRDFRLNPEHPPLAKLLAALPLLLLHPSFDTSQQDWTTASEYAFGFRFLYTNDADQLLFWGRVPMILLAAMGAAVTFLWANDLFGRAAGLVAVSLYAFSPNLLGHGMLVTTDVPLAAFTVLTLYLFWKGRDGWAGLALGCAMATKFSGAFLPVLLVVLCFAHDYRSALKRIGILALGALIVLEAAYLFTATPIQYFRNAALVNSNHVRDYPVYLFGRVKTGGWWYYFPAAMLVKATVPMLLMIVLAASHTVAGWANRWGEVILLTSIIIYTVLVSVGADQIGVRYLLPIFPLMFVWTSRLVPYFSRRRAGVFVIVTLMVWEAWSSFKAFPNYIPYFNEVAEIAGYNGSLLDDSNIDWGQALKQTAVYVRQHKLTDVTLYTFSPFDNPEYYGLPPNLSREEALERLAGRQPPPGVYILSAHRVVRLRATNPAWKTYKLLDRIGDSMWVYAF